MDRRKPHRADICEQTDSTLRCGDGVARAFVSALLEKDGGKGEEDRGMEEGVQA